MPLTPGNQLGCYQILGPIGAGGMGEVYRARDTRLNRDVAIKVLPELFAGDADRLARFTREAQTLASLNHPNIAAIYGIEHSGGTRALVMELVEGQDLSELIRLSEAGTSSGLPFEDAVAIARQIADALEAAHEQGIVHRDLKPANIKVREDGTVKVLDFGLAKALDPSTEHSAPGTQRGSIAATMTSPAMTAMGMIIGTAAYMSPEQARGRAVNRRADVWAFGCVLYEMLTGRRAFTGDDISITLANVLKDDVKWDALPADLPASLRRLLRRCLEKDPAKRLDSMAAARLELDETTDSGEALGAVSQRRSQILPWAIAATAVIALAAWVAISRPWAPAATAPALRVSAAAGFLGELGRGLRPELALSPDGRTVVFAALGAQPAGLYVRHLDQSKATFLSGTEGGSGPFFSYDGLWIAYFAQGKLYKILVNGGAAVPLADATVSRGGTWGDDNVITFSPGAAPGGTLLRVSADGGVTSPLGAMPNGHATQRWPQALPGGHAVLYTGAPTADNFDDACLVVQTLDGAPPRVLKCGGSFWTYVSSGHVLFAHAGTVFAAPFDLSQLAFTGEGVPVLEGVRSASVSGVAQFTVSRDGLLAYISGEGTGSSATPIEVVDRQGKATRLSGKPVNWANLSFSPEGERLAMDVSSPTGRSIWVHDLTRDAGQPVTFGILDAVPIWTPNGLRITFSSVTRGAAGLFWVDAAGGTPERLTESARQQIPGSWSPDGLSLAYTEIRNDAGDVMILPMESDGRSGLKPGVPRAFAATGARESSPAFSPDGKWLAYASSESSTLQVYVSPVANPARKWPVSIDGGNQPMWSRTSPQLLFRTEESSAQILAVTYTETSDGAFRASRPAVWSPAQFGLRSGVHDVALHPDGRRIAGALQTSSSVTAPTEPLFVLVTNFFDDVRDKLRVTAR